MPCAKTLENALLESLGIFSVMLHDMHTQDISNCFLESAEQSDHSDSTSGDSHVTKMAVISGVSRICKRGVLGCKCETNARAKQDWNAIKAARLLYIRYRNV